MSLSWLEYSQKIFEHFRQKIDIPIPISEEKCAVACSGGIDSVFLTLYLYRYLDSRHLVILHYNHNTRNFENTIEEQFVQNIADNLGIDMISRKREETGHDNEDNLRKQRFDFFEQTAKQLSIKYLFLAHHADDILETMLMRLAYGSSEIAAPKPIHKTASGLFLLRPMLNVQKKEVIQIFQRYNIPWQEDSSNTCQDYLRNRIRNLLKNFDQIFLNRNWKSGFLASYRQLIDDNNFIQSHVDQYSFTSDTLNLNGQKSPAILRRLIPKWLAKHQLTKSSLEKLIFKIIHNEKTTVDINSDLYLTFCNENLKIHCKKTKNFTKYTFNQWVFGDIFLPTGAKLSRQLVDLDDLDLSLKSDHQQCVFITPKFHSISIRTYNDGDRYLPIHSTHTKKLKNLFSERHIDPNLRKQLPVLCNQEEKILWVPNLPPAEIAKVENKVGIKITFSST